MATLTKLDTIANWPDWASPPFDRPPPEYLVTDINFYSIYPELEQIKGEHYGYESLKRISKELFIGDFRYVNVLGEAYFAEYQDALLFMMKWC